MHPLMEVGRLNWSDHRPADVTALVEDEGYIWLLHGTFLSITFMVPFFAWPLRELTHLDLRSSLHVIFHYSTFFVPFRASLTLLIILHPFL
jgi:hypothetical protein